MRRSRLFMPRAARGRRRRHAFQALRRRGLFITTNERCTGFIMHASAPSILSPPPQLLPHGAAPADPRPPRRNITQPSSRPTESDPHASQQQRVWGLRRRRRRGWARRGGGGGGGGRRRAPAGRRRAHGGSRISTGRRRGARRPTTTTQRPLHQQLWRTAAAAASPVPPHACHTRRPGHNPQARYGNSPPLRPRGRRAVGCRCGNHGAIVAACCSGGVRPSTWVGTCRGCIRWPGTRGSRRRRRRAAPDDARALRSHAAHHRPRLRRCCLRCRPRTRHRAPRRLHAPAAPRAAAGATPRARLRRRHRRGRGRHGGRRGDPGVRRELAQRRARAGVGNEGARKQVR